MDVWRDWIVSVRGGVRGIFLLTHNAGNPMKNHDSDEKIQEKPRKTKAQNHANRAKLTTKQGGFKNFQITPPASAQAPRLRARRRLCRRLRPKAARPRSAPAREPALRLLDPASERGEQRALGEAAAATAVGRLRPGRDG